MQGVRPRVRARSAHQRPAGQDLPALQGAPGEAADLPDVLPPEGRRLVLGSLLEARRQREEGRRLQGRLRHQADSKPDSAKPGSGSRPASPTRQARREARLRLARRATPAPGRARGLRAAARRRRPDARAQGAAPHAPLRPPRRPRRAHRRVRRLRDARAVRRHPRRAPRGARARRALRRLPHGADPPARARGALAGVARLVTCPVASLRIGQVRYGLLCNEAGGVVDDVTVYRSGRGRLLPVRQRGERREGLPLGGAPRAARAREVRDRSDRDGPARAPGPGEHRAAGAPLPSPIRGRCGASASSRDASADRPALVSRTGYTGSDGFELYCAADDAGAIWDALLESGSARRPRARGARRPGHAAPRGGAAPLRPRARRRHLTPRSRPRAFRRSRAERLRRRRGAAAPVARRPAPAASSACCSRGAASRAPDTPSPTAAATSAGSPRAPPLPPSENRSPSATFRRPSRRSGRSSR